MSVSKELQHLVNEKTKLNYLQSEQIKIVIIKIFAFLLSGKIHNNAHLDM